MAKKPRQAKPAGEESPAPSGREHLPERWSAQRKTELVLPLLRGQPYWTGNCVAIPIARPARLGQRPASVGLPVIARYTLRRKALHDRGFSWGSPLGRIWEKVSPV
jgi:hypothetical protein